MSDHRSVRVWLSTGGKYYLRGKFRYFLVKKSSGKINKKVQKVGKRGRVFKK